MNLLKTPWLILCLAFAGVSCEKQEAPSGNATEPPIAETAQSPQYSFDTEIQEHRWPLAPHPDSKLVYGWAVLTQSDEGRSLGIHGGVASNIPITEPTVLSFKSEFLDGFLHGKFSRTRFFGEDINASESAMPPGIDVLVQTHSQGVRSDTGSKKFAIPDGASWSTSANTNYSGLTHDYEVLWQADITHEGQPDFSVVYFARLVPREEPNSKIIGKDNMPALEAALLAQ